MQGSLARRQPRFDGFRQCQMHEEKMNPNQLFRKA
jgi:hypothetical protein